MVAVGLTKPYRYKSDRRVGFGYPGIGWWMVIAIDEEVYRATRVHHETAIKVLGRVATFTDWPGFWILRPPPKHEHTLSVKEFRRGQWKKRLNQTSLFHSPEGRR